MKRRKTISRTLLVRPRILWSTEYKQLRYRTIKSRSICGSGGARAREREEVKNSGKTIHEADHEATNSQGKRSGHIANAE